MIEKRKTIALTTLYDLPEDVNVAYHRGKIIVIAPECANYIVLDNEVQLSFFNLLRSNDIGTALSKLDISLEDSRQVVTQIEAKQFVNNPATQEVGLFQMQLHVTNACNMRCPHCYMYSGCPDDNELTLEEIKGLLTSFKNNDGRFVIFSGGEVLVRRDFPIIVKYAAQLGLSVNIMSNGVLWTQSLIDELSPYISSIQISVDGYDEETNAPIRGVGNFARALKTVEMFLAHNIHTTIAITPWLEDDMEAKIPHYIRFRRDLESRFASPCLEIKFNGDLMSGRDITIFDKERGRYALAMSKIRNAEQNESMDEDIFIYNLQQRSIKKNWCTYGHLTISATGDVFFCGKITQCGTVGNVRELPLQEIMNLSKVAREEASVTEVEPCRKCGLRYICGGDCRIIYFDYFKYGKNHLAESKVERRGWRVCTPLQKSYWYDLMLSANEKLYR